MGAAPLLRIVPDIDSEPAYVTLLELVDAVSDVTDDDKEVVATVLWMLRSGRVELAGNFRHVPVEEFCRSAASK